MIAPALATTLLLLATTGDVDGGSAVQQVRLEVTEADGGILGVLPAQLPPTKTRLSFDRIGGSEAEEARRGRLRDAMTAIVNCVNPGVCAYSCTDQKAWPTEPAAKGLEYIVTLVDGIASSVVKSDEYGCLSPSERSVLAGEIRARLRDTGDIAHREVVWDPAESEPLMKTVQLPQGLWQVSLASQPVEYQPAPFSNSAWTVLCTSGKAPLAPRAAPRSTPQALAFFQTSDQGRGLYPGDQCGSLPGWRSVPIDFYALDRQPALNLLAAFGEQGESRTPVGSVPRAFSLDAEKMASDALQAVADVAVVRAQQASLEVTRKVIVSRLCDDWVSVLKTQLGARWGFDGAAFTRSCAVLRAINPSSLGTLGTTLRTALLADAMDLLTSFVGERLASCLAREDRGCGDLHRVPALEHVAPTLAILAGVVSAGFFDSDSTLPRAQAFVAQVVRQQRERVATQNGCTDTATMALVALAYCHRSGGCDSHSIRSLIEHPERYLNGVAVCTGSGADSMLLARRMGDMVSVVSHGLAVMAPRKGDDSKAHVLNALRFGKGIVRLVLTDESCTGSSTCEQSAREINDGFDVLFAVAQEQPVQILVMLGSVLSKATDGRIPENGIAMVTALATYAETYGAPEGQLTPDQRRERRAQAVAALADIAHQRQFRVGEWAIGFGAWVGPRWGYSRYLGADSTLSTSAWQANAQLAIPVGLTFERRLAKSHGLWVGLSLADAGAYTSTTFGTCSTTPERAAGDCVVQNPSPAAAVSLGASFGYLFLDDFTASVDIRYRPWPQAKEVNPEWGLGAGISYQIPLLWLQ